MAVKTVPGIRSWQNMDIFDECELIWLPNVLPLNIIQIWYDVNEHEVIQCWEQKKIVFSRGKILEILYLRKGYNYDYKKMLGLVIC